MRFRVMTRINYFNEESGKFYDFPLSAVMLSILQGAALKGMRFTNVTIYNHV